MLVSVAWGNTRLKLENGSTLTIPRQILQAKRSHVAHQYKIHCSEVNFQPLSDRKLLYLLESVNTRSQKQVRHNQRFGISVFLLYNIHIIWMIYANSLKL